MRKLWLQKGLAFLLTLALCFTFFPASAYAEEGQPDGEQITGETVGTDATDTDGAADTSAAVQALIDALPTVEEVRAMPEAEQSAAYGQAQEAHETYHALTEEEQAQTDAAKIEALLQYFSEQVAPTADGTAAEPDSRQAAQANVSYQECSWNGGAVTKTEQMAENCTVVDGTTTAWSGTKNAPGWYVVNSNVTISERITVTGNVHLILADGCTLTASKGIQVQSGNSLTIYGQSGGTGTLTATGELNMAGIGGNGNESATGGTAGTINIHGGIVEAKGGHGLSGAGIGGGGGTGASGKVGGDGGTVNIYGGTVRAEGGVNAAGIGGGGSTASGATAGSGGTVNIYGGTVTAVGGMNGAAGIGGGWNSSASTGNEAGAAGTCTINGGVIYATSIADSNTTSRKGIIADIDATYDTASGGTYYSNSLTTKTITVCGEQTLTEDFTVPAGCTMTIPTGAALTVPGEGSLTAEGILTVEGTLTNSGITTVNMGGKLDLSKGSFSGNEVQGEGVTVGPFLVKGGVKGTDFDFQETADSNDFGAPNKLTIKTDKQLTLSTPNNEGNSPAEAWIIGNNESGNWNAVSVVLDGVNITAPSGKSAINVGNNLALTLEDGTTNTLRGCNISSEGTTTTRGINANGNLTISGSGTLNAIGGEITVSDSNNSNRSCGIESAGAITISGGTVNATGGAVKNGSSYGIRAYNSSNSSITSIIISGGTVTATGGTVTENSNGGSYGMLASPHISGGTVTATGGEAAARSYGIYIDTTASKITITGGSGMAKTISTNAAKKQAMDKEPTLAGVTTTGTYDSAEMSWAPIISVTSIELNPTSATLTVDGETTLAATVQPGNATNQAVTWSSSNAEIAAVDSGKVTAKKAGTATITVTTVDGSHTATCAITVQPKSQTAPAEAPTIASHTASSITLTAVSAHPDSKAVAEYGRKTAAGEITWQTSPEFTGLVKDTPYIFVVRYAAVDGIYDASQPSPEYTSVIPHDYTGEWQKEEAGHWHKCKNDSCNETDEKKGHTFVWKIDKEAEEGVPGSKHEECETCHYAKAAVEIPAKPQPEYPPVIQETGGGTANVDKPNPKPGDKVTVVTKPETGKVVDKVTVTDKDGNQVEVKDNGDGTYTFVQPDGEVTIKVTFKDNPGGTGTTKPTKPAKPAKPTTTTKTAQTGDHNRIWLWAALLAVSGAVCIGAGAAVWKKRRR